MISRVYSDIFIFRLRRIQKEAVCFSRFLPQFVSSLSGFHTQWPKSIFKHNFKFLKARKVASNINTFGDKVWRRKKLSISKFFKVQASYFVTLMSRLFFRSASLRQFGLFVREMISLWFFFCSLSRKLLLMRALRIARGRWFFSKGKVVPMRNYLLCIFFCWRLTDYGDSCQQQRADTINY